MNNKISNPTDYPENKVIEVMNLNTGEFVYYMNISPEQAVINAFEQNKGNWNTWDYNNIQHTLIKGKSSIACGNFSALLEQ